MDELKMHAWWAKNGMIYESWQILRSLMKACLAIDNLTR